MTNVIRAGKEFVRELEKADWGVKDAVNPKKAGMFDGRDVESLEKEYHNLKKTGPHKKGSKEFTKMHQLLFAIRSKKGWDKKGTTK